MALKVRPPSAVWVSVRPSAVETAYLLHRGSQVITRQLWILDEAIVPITDFVTGRVDDRDLIGLDQSEVVVAVGDEPVPLRVGEEAVPTGVVGRRIGATEQLGEQRRDHVEVGGAANDVPRCLP